MLKYSCASDRQLIPSLLMLARIYNRIAFFIKSTMSFHVNFSLLKIIKLHLFSGSISTAPPLAIFCDVLQPLAHVYEIFRHVLSVVVICGNILRSFAKDLKGQVKYLTSRQVYNKNLSRIQFAFLSLLIHYIAYAWIHSAWLPSFAICWCDTVSINSA